MSGWPDGPTNGPDGPHNGSGLGRVEKSKNGFGSYGYYFLNGFWYIENGGNFFFGIREYLDKWNFT